MTAEDMPHYYHVTIRQCGQQWADVVSRTWYINHRAYFGPLMEARAATAKEISDHAGSKTFKDNNRIKEEGARYNMYIKIKGINVLDNLSFTSIVSSDSVEDVRAELIECMGIEAHSQEVFDSELMDIGFDIYTKIVGVDVDTLPIVEIPINLTEDNSNIF